MPRNEAAEIRPVEHKYPPRKFSQSRSEVEYIYQEKSEDIQRGKHQNNPMAIKCKKLNNKPN